MIVPRVPVSLECQVIITATGLPKSSGTIYAYVWRHSDGYYLTSAGAWQAAKPTVGGGTLPTASYKAAGIWYYTLATTVTDDLSPGDQVTAIFIDNETEASATTSSSPVTHTVDLPAAEVRDIVESQRGQHSQQSAGPTIYVGPVNGNDTTGNGSRLLPYKTITKALSVITTGTHSTIFVLADQGNAVTTLTEDITVNKRYVFIRGPGRDLLIKASSANTPTFTISANGVELSGFQLESSASGANAHGVSATSADFLSVHDVFINATQGTGVLLTNCSNSRVNRCTFQGTGASATGHGLIMASSGGGSSTYNEVCDNTFRDIQGDGIRLTHTGGGTHSDARICGNSVGDSTAYGINIGSGVSHACLSENTFGNNASGDINDAGTGTELGTYYTARHVVSGGVAITGASNGAALSLTGTGSGAGLLATGGATGAGIDAEGSGNFAIKAESVAGVFAANLAGAIESAVLDAVAADHVDGGSVGEKVNAIGTPTAATIADAVWDEALSGHTTSGTTGAELAMLGAGIGSETLTVTVLTSLAAAVNGATVYAHNAGGAIVGTGITNSSGVVVLNPGVGTSTLTAVYAGYTIPAVSVTVATGVNQTASMTATAASTPASAGASSCVLYATLKGNDGSAAASQPGTCRVVRLPQELSSVFYADTVVSSTSDVTGVISFTMPRGAVVRVSVPDFIPETTLTVPSAATCDISTLL